MSTNIENTKKPSDSNKNPYRECCLFKKDVCGTFKNGRVLCEGLEDIDKLKEFSVEEYLANNLHFKDSLQLIKWNEKLLIENRLGHPLNEDKKICQYHRYILGTKWRPHLQCSHQLHEKVKSGKKAAKTYRIPLAAIMKLNSITPYSYKVGAQMCKSHEKSIKDALASNEDDEYFEIDEQPYIPPVYILEDDTLEKQHDLASTLCVSPIKFRISKPIDELSDSNVRYFKRKREEFVSAAGAVFDGAFAPGQSKDEVRNVLLYRTPDQNDIPDDLYLLVENYVESDSFGKMVILSLVNHEIHSKRELMKIFGCSKRRIEQARSMRSKNVGVSSNEKVTFRRNRLNTEKCEHFLDFLFSSGLMQDVAYGVTNLKFDSGDTQSIPHAILQSKFSHTIGFYLKVCKELDYIPLSENTLWKILRSIKPSQRKSLAGLDDITASAMNAFQFLQKVLVDLNTGNERLTYLERAKRYLKFNYQGHCNLEATIVTHNTAFALSLPNEEPCLDVSDEVCAECYNVMDVLQKILDIALQSENADLIYDVNNAVNNIIDYMKHQIRDEQQKQAKIFCFEQINEETAFWLRDYSQKILPTSYREGQRTYFGKKGMTMHVDVFFTKYQNQLEKVVYLTLVYRCDQTKIDTMNISSHVLSEFRKDFPEICNMYGKSDNAGCYHGNQILENLYKLCKSKGVNLLRYDYNEPCRGKDQCDRESAGVKSLINSYVDAGNDVICATDIFDALHYGRGMRNSKAGVLEIDSSASTLSGQSISGVNSFHSAQFFEKHMRLYRYFNVGKGKVVKYSCDSNFKPSYNVIKEFSRTSSDSSKAKKKKTASNSLLFCPEAICSMVFEDEKEYEHHLLSESHTPVKHTSAMDKVRASFVQKMKISSSLHQIHSSTKVKVSEVKLASARETVSLFSKVANQGWAIPQKNNFRYSYQQKKFLYQVFMEGKETGKKKSPEETEKLVRKHFSSTKDYVTAAQIRALFSKYTIKVKEGTLTAPTPGLTIECDNAAEDIPVIPDDTSHQRELTEVVDEVMSTISSWKPGTWVVIRYKRQWLPGRIIPADDCHEPLDEDCFVIDCMERKQYGINCFKWPNSRDLLVAERDELLLEIQEITPIEQTEQLTTGEIVWCTLSETDFEDANESLRRSLREEE